MGGIKVRYERRHPAIASIAPEQGSASQLGDQPRVVIVEFRRRNDYVSCDGEQVSVQASHRAGIEKHGARVIDVRARSGEGLAQFLDTLFHDGDASSPGLPAETAQQPEHPAEDLGRRPGFQMSFAVHAMFRPFASRSDERKALNKLPVCLYQASSVQATYAPKPIGSLSVDYSSRPLLAGPNKCPWL